MDLNRKVGAESQKTYQDKCINGFFSRFMSGQGIELGFQGYNGNTNTILPNCIGIDRDFPGYDGTILPFPDDSQDYVYSSHTLEHIDNYLEVIREWHRIVKIGGHIIIVVPHQYLYEKKKSLPSNYNGNHKRFYTPSVLLAEIEAALTPKSYRAVFLEDGDKDYDYNIPPETHAGGSYEITVVLKKIATPTWTLE